MRKRTRRSGSNIGAYTGVFLIVFIFSMLLTYIIISKNIGDIMSLLGGGPKTLLASISEIAENNEKDNTASSSEIESEINIITPSESSKEEPKKDLKASVTPDEINDWIPPQVEATKNEYFQHSLFVGDSQVSGLAKAKESMIKYYLARDEIEAEKAMTEKIFGTSSQKTTLFENMKKYKPSSIYIMLGGRSLTYLDNKDSVSYYKKFIKEVKAQHPKIPIFVQAVLPVTEEHEQDNNYDNDKINSLNLEIMQMCQSENVYYLDLSEEFKDVKGNLDEKYASSNGKNLNNAGYDLWEEYLKSHWIDFS